MSLCVPLLARIWYNYSDYICEDCGGRVSRVQPVRVNCVSNANLKTVNIYAMTACAMFFVVIVLGTFLRIPIPPVPITLQVQTVLLCGMLLGRRCALVCVLLYLFAGLIGLPVFAGGGGIGYVLMPTFGFLVGFAPGAYVTGLLTRRPPRDTWFSYVVASIAGTAIIYAVGMLYFVFIAFVYLRTNMDVWESVSKILMYTLPADLILNLAVSVAAKRLRPYIQKLLSANMRPTQRKEGGTSL